MAQYSGVFTLSQASQAIKDNNWTGLPPQNVEYLIVAGGGSGAGNRGIGGGGGAGGLLAGFSGVTVGTQLWVTVGAGGVDSGSANGGVGNNSVLLATSSAAITGNIVASGGGTGGEAGVAGYAGGSGGGGSRAFQAALVYQGKEMQGVLDNHQLQVHIKVAVEAARELLGYNRLMVAVALLVMEVQG